MRVDFHGSIELGTRRLPIGVRQSAKRRAPARSLQDARPGTVFHAAQIDRIATCPSRSAEIGPCRAPLTLECKKVTMKTPTRDCGGLLKCAGGWPGHGCPRRSIRTRSSTVRPKRPAESIPEVQSNANAPTEYRLSSVSLLNVSQLWRRQDFPGGLLDAQNTISAQSRRHLRGFSTRLACPKGGP